MVCIYLLYTTQKNRIPFSVLFIFLQNHVVILYNYWLWNRFLSGFIIMKKCNIHRTTGEVNIRFKRLINQIATYSKVNECLIWWKCFNVIYLQIHRHTNKISQFWSACLWFSRKTTEQMQSHWLLNNERANLIG